MFYNKNTSHHKANSQLEITPEYIATIAQGTTTSMSIVSSVFRHLLLSELPAIAWRVFWKTHSAATRMLSWSMYKRNKLIRRILEGDQPNCEQRQSSCVKDYKCPRSHILLDKPKFSPWYLPQAQRYTTKTILCSTSRVWRNIISVILPIKQENSFELSKDLILRKPLSQRQLLWLSIKNIKLELSPILAKVIYTWLKEKCLSIL